MRLLQAILEMLPMLVEKSDEKDHILIITQLSCNKLNINSISNLIR